MQFKFFSIAEGGEATTAISEQSAFAFEMLSDCGTPALQAAVFERFAEIVRDYPMIGSVFVLSPTVGKPPGAIVAAELCHANPRKPRQLQWLYQLI